MTGRSLVDAIMIEEMFWDQTQELIFAGLACWMAQHLLPVSPSENPPPFEDCPPKILIEEQQK
jgi:hypothetical protein